ncbi:MAG: hypothetical protein H3C31_13545 [Brumimicrobium sp.]|nr:hypothetical protein [Brumimicrobium sp.]
MSQGLTKEDSALTGRGLGIDSFSMRQEVSRGHSTLGNEPSRKEEKSGGLTNKGRTEHE